MAAAGEEIRLQQRADPYMARSLDMRSEGNLMVAHHLHSALVDLREQRLAEAASHVSEARRLAPEWFEVRRVEAALRAQEQNMPAALDAYQAAIDLEPSSAPLRLRYGLFLATSLEDYEGAIAEFEAGLELDPSASVFHQEIARARMQQERYSDAADELETTLAQSGGLAEAQLVRLFDLYLLVQSRRVEEECRAHRPHEAFAILQQLMRHVDRIPRAILPRVRDRLERLVPIARNLVRSLPRGDIQKTASELAGRVVALAERAGNTGPQPVDAGVERTGTVVRLVTDRAFGFIRDSSGEDFFFHFSRVRGSDDPKTLRVGTRVAFRARRDDKGRPQAEYVAPVGAFASKT